MGGWEGSTGPWLQQGWRLCSGIFLFFASSENLFVYLLIFLFWSDLLKGLKSTSAG